MNIGTTQLFGGDFFTGGRFYQWRATQKNSALFFHNHSFIAHTWNIGTAGCTGSHHNGNLGNVHG